MSSSTLAPSRARAETRPARHDEHAQPRLVQQLDQLTRAIHASLDLDEAASRLANEGRLFIGCDRLSVAVCRGDKFRVTAISSQHELDRRSEVLRRMEACLPIALGDRVVAYPESEFSLDDDVAALLDDYLDASHAKALLLVPLRAVDEGPVGERPTQIVGALVLEQFTSQSLGEMRPRAESVADHGAICLRNAERCRAVPFWRYWQARAAYQDARAKHRSWKMFLALGLASIAAALILIRADFRVRADGELLPTIRRQVFARMDGVVHEIRVRHGDHVRAGDVLAILHNPDLDFQWTRVAGEVQTARKKLGAIQAARLERAPTDRADGQHYRDLTTEEEELKQWLTSLELQQELLMAQKADLVVTSPIAGRVTTWDVAHLLTARPVQRGQPLLTVADDTGPWSLELRLPDSQIGHVLKARQHASQPLSVTYALGNDPSRVLRGQLERIGLATETPDDQPPTVRLHVRVRASEIHHLRSGATSTARIDCGRASLAYVLFRDVLEYMQFHLWY